MEFMGDKKMQVIKRDGNIVDFDQSKIEIAIGKANKEVKPSLRASKEDIKEIVNYINELDKKRILVEDIQDIIEEKLMEQGHYRSEERRVGKECMRPC